MLFLMEKACSPELIIHLGPWCFGLFAQRTRKVTLDDGVFCFKLVEGSSVLPIKMDTCKTPWGRNRHPKAACKIL